MEDRYLHSGAINRAIREAEQGLPIPRWQTLGLWRDPELMHPRERESAQLFLMERWLMGKGIDPVTGHKIGEGVTSMAKGKSGKGGKKC